MRAFCFLRLGIPLLGVLLATTAVGAGTLEDAFAHLESGRKHLQSDEHREAIERFRKAANLVRPLKGPEANMVRLVAELGHSRALNGRLSAIAHEAQEKNLVDPAELMQASEESLWKALDALQAAGDSPATPKLLEECWKCLVLDQQICENQVRIADRRFQAGENPAEIIAELEKRLTRFTERIERLGLEPTRKAACFLCLAEWSWERKNLNDLQRLLGRMEELQSTAASLESFSWQYWQLKARLHIQLRQYEEAHFALRQALQIANREHEALPPEELPPGQMSASARPGFRAMSDQILGFLYLRQGDYPRARDTLQTAVDRFQRRGVLAAEPPRTPQAMQERHAALYGLQNLALAHARLAATKGNETSGYERALELLDKAYRLTDATNESHRELQSMILNSRGLILFTLGRFDAARTAYEESLAHVTKAFGAEHPQQGESRVNLAWLDLETGQIEASTAGFLEALQIFRAAGEEFRETECLAYLARSLTHQGDAAQAAELLLEAAERRYQLVRRSLQSVANERDRLVLVQELRLHTEVAGFPGVFDSLIELAPQLGIEPRQQYEHQLRWKGILTRQAPAADALEDDPQIQDLARRREQLLDRIQEFAAGTAFYSLARKQLDAEGFQTFEKDFQSQEAQVAEVQRKLENVNRELARQSPRFRIAIREPATFEAIVQRLPATAALFDVLEVESLRSRKAGEMTQNQRRYVGFAVTPDGQVRRVELGSGGDASTLDTEIRRYYELLQDRDYPNDYILKQGAKLAQWIRDPLLEAVPSARLWIVSGDGWLHRLPFGALPGEPEGTFWIEQAAFSCVQTADRLVRPRAPGKEGALLVGGLDYGTPPPDARTRKIPWQPLNDTLYEINDIRQRFAGSSRGPVDVRSKRQATEAKLTDLLPRFAYIHLATHGNFAGRLDREPNEAFAIFDPQDRLSSSLVLSDANRMLEAADARDANKKDQYLTAEEVARLDLHGTRLVVLSACQTGLGHVREGQGLIGVLAALDEAGAETVVSSLWNVNSKATAKLMLSFYDRYLSDQQPLGPADAMRAAQMACRNGRLRTDAGSPMDHPYYWSPWIVSGLPER